MYRDPSLSLSETIARLEAEVLELRALGGKRRERRLVIATVISMIVAVHAVIGCVATKVQAERFERDASHRLNGRADDLVRCVHALSARNREIEVRSTVAGDLCRCPGSAPEWALSTPVW
jgi:hypothetical protein